MAKEEDLLKVMKHVEKLETELEKRGHTSELATKKQAVQEAIVGILENEPLTYTALHRAAKTRTSIKISRGVFNHSLKGLEEEGKVEKEGRKYRISK